MSKSDKIDNFHDVLRKLFDFWNLLNKEKKMEIDLGRKN